MGPLGTIIIKCKDFRIIQLDIPGMEECLNIASSIEVSILEANCVMKINSKEKEPYILTQCSSYVSSLDMCSCSVVQILKTDRKSFTLIHVIGM